MTEGEKIEALWRRLDQLNSEKANVETQLAAERAAHDQTRGEADQLRSTVADLSEQVLSLARQVNESRVAAAGAVSNYIASQAG